MPRWLLPARLVLGYVAIGHVLTSLLALVATDQAIAIGADLYGASFEPTDQFRYTIRALGAFQLALGILQMLAIRDPWRYTPVINVTLLVLALRILQRVLFAPLAMSAFGLSAARHWANTAHMLVAALLLLAVRLALRTAPQDQAAGRSPATEP